MVGLFFKGRRFHPHYPGDIQGTLAYTNPGRLACNESQELLSGDIDLKGFLDTHKKINELFQDPHADRSKITELVKNHIEIAHERFLVYLENQEEEEDSSLNYYKEERFSGYCRAN